MVPSVMIVSTAVHKPFGSATTYLRFRVEWTLLALTLPSVNRDDLVSLSSCLLLELMFRS
jgi:hypothetical protein